MLRSFVLTRKYAYSDRFYELIKFIVIFENNNFMSFFLPHVNDTRLIALSLNYFL